jgi:hypothetical protein
MAILGKKGKGNLPNVSVSKKVKSHASDPFVIRKVKEAEAFVNKYGLPAAFTR